MIIGVTRKNDDFMDRYEKTLYDLGNHYIAAGELNNLGSLGKELLQIEQRAFSDNLSTNLRMSSFYYREVSNLLLGTLDTAIYYLRQIEELASELGRDRTKASAQGALAKAIYFSSHGW